jgi:hypothetical protein
MWDTAWQGQYHFLASKISVICKETWIKDKNKLQSNSKELKEHYRSFLMK